MSSHLPRRKHYLISLLVVSLWAGWTSMGLASLGRHSATDPTVLLNVLEHLPVPVRDHPAPVAVLLPPRCSCEQDVVVRPLLDRTIAEQGGTLQVLPSRAGWMPEVELIVFDQQRQPVYSGPLSPPPGSCGPADTTDPRSWLNALMDGRQPPLHLGPMPCTC